METPATQETTGQEQPKRTVRKTKAKAKRKRTTATRKAEPTGSPVPELSGENVSTTVNAAVINDASIRRLLNAQPKAKIMIPAGQAEHEQLPVDVQIHGYNFRIRRGFEVEVPEAVVHVLENAISMHIHMKPRENGEGMERVFSEGHRFPFQTRR